MLEVSPPSTLACCKHGPVDTGGGCNLVGGARAASGEVTRWCLDSSHPVVVALSTFVEDVGSFCGAVFELGVVFALSFSSVCGKVLATSISSGCCSDWPLRRVVGREEFDGESASFSLSNPATTPLSAC